MEAKSDLTKHPEKFSFGQPKQKEYGALYQRFVDADLASVDSEIMLEQEYGTPEKSWITPIVIVLTLLVLAVVGYTLRTRKTESIAAARYQVPENITPFTVLGVLKDIERNNGLSDAGKQELGTSISRLEHFYFEEPEGEGDEPDLHEVIHRWIRKST